MFLHISRSVFFFIIAIFFLHGLESKLGGKKIGFLPGHTVDARKWSWFIANAIKKPYHGLDFYVQNLIGVGWEVP